MGSELFHGVGDRYNGITVYSQDESCENTQLSTKLSESLKEWQKQKKRCIWFKVDIKDATWVPVLAAEGFNFHHCKDSYVMMYKWLEGAGPCNVPPPSHTSVGVGGIVLDTRGRLLAVSERHVEYPHWKLPGGYVEQGEDIRAAAEREVREETGVRAEFESLVTLRHAHGMAFGMSDVYVVVMLRAATEDIARCDQEISACRWMDVQEFLEHPHVHEFNRFIVRQALDLQRRKLRLDLKKHTVKIHTFSREITSLVLEDL